MSREAYASRDFCLSYIFQYLFHISLPAEDYGVVVLIKHVFGGGDSDKLVTLLMASILRLYLLRIFSCMMLWPLQLLIMGIS